MQSKPILDRVFRGNAPAVYLAQGEALGLVVHQRWRAKGPAVLKTLAMVGLIAGPSALWC